MASLLIVGEAHAPSADPTLPAFHGNGGGSELRLLDLMGVDEWPDCVRTANLLLPGREWSLWDAATMAGFMWRNAQEQFWVLCGSRVCQAFRFPGPLFGWAEAEDGRWVAAIPHPSGRNRVWNDPLMVTVASEFMRSALDAATGF